MHRYPNKYLLHPTNSGQVWGVVCAPKPWRIILLGIFCVLDLSMNLFRKPLNWWLSVLPSADRDHLVVNQTSPSFLLQWSIHQGDSTTFWETLDLLQVVGKNIPKCSKKKRWDLMVINLMVEKCRKSTNDLKRIHVLCFSIFFNQSIPKFTLRTISDHHFLLLDKQKSCARQWV